MVAQQRSETAPPIGKAFFDAPLGGQRETASNKCGGGDDSHKRGKTTKEQIAQCKSGHPVAERGGKAIVVTAQGLFYSEKRERA